MEGKERRGEWGRQSASGAYQQSRITLARSADFSRLWTGLFHGGWLRIEERSKPNEFGAPGVWSSYAPYVCGNLLPGNVCGCYRPLWGGGRRWWDRSLEGGKLKTLANWLYRGHGLGKGAVHEGKGFISRKALLAYHAKTGR